MKEKNKTTSAEESLRFAIVLDFEATCDQPHTPRPQEIIELPSVIVDTGANPAEIGGSFESFVRPVHHPVLTPFCTKLTSIEQADVENADDFPAVLARHQTWLTDEQLDETNAVFVTCGDWDLKTMLPHQCRAAGVSHEDLPPIYRRWMNIKRTFTEVTRRKRGGMASMMRSVGLELRGHHHRGIDDCHNLARLLVHLVARGARVRPTAHAGPPRP